MIRKAIGTVKDQVSIGLAKVNGSTMLSKLHVAIVNATRHSEHPADERYAREIVAIMCRSGAYVTACVAALSRRLRKTRSWAVALKTLALVYRLLDDGDPAYEEEVHIAAHGGGSMLDASDFWDSSGSAAPCYFSAFVRGYARYLEESLEFRMHDRRGRRGRRLGWSRLSWCEVEGREEEKAPGATPVRDMKTERIFLRTQQLQQLLDRFLACRPTGAAKNHRLVAVVLYPLVKESFQTYFDLAEIIGIFVDRFMELPVPTCHRVRDAFTRLSKQLEELDAFYSWCKAAGISRPSEFPSIDHVTPMKLEVMDEFIQRRSAMAQTYKLKSSEPKTGPPPEQPKPDEGIRSPPPKRRSEAELKYTSISRGAEEKAMKGEEHSEKLALALFDGNPTATASAAWEAFPESSDWETELVQSASRLAGRNLELGGGFDMAVLDGGYSQVALGAATGGGSGSASSVAAGAGEAGLMALPACSEGGVDPFAASLAVPPPAWVQSAEIERKQRMLAEEQLMWRQYVRGGMQGDPGITKLDPSLYPMGGYTRTF